jgi:hypothetical protein
VVVRRREEQAVKPLVVGGFECTELRANFCQSVVAHFGPSTVWRFGKYSFNQFVWETQNVEPNACARAMISDPSNHPSVAGLAEFLFGSKLLWAA